MIEDARRLLAAGRRPSFSTLRTLYDLRIELERKQAAGPWDEWDGQLVDKWLIDVKESIRMVECDLSFRLSEEVR